MINRLRLNLWVEQIRDHCILFNLFVHFQIKMKKYMRENMEELK